MVIRVPTPPQKPREVENWQDLSGKKAHTLIFPDSGTVYPQDGGSIVCRYEYMGNHSVVFMVEVSANGQEIARHNIQFIESILWIVSREETK